VRAKTEREERERIAHERWQGKQRRSEIRVLSRELGEALANLDDVNIPLILLDRVKRLRELRGD
jgi:hypothetical protein